MILFMYIICCILALVLTRKFLQIATQADLGLADAYIHGDFSFVDKQEGLLNLFLVRKAIMSPTIENYTFTRIFHITSQYVGHLPCRYSQQIGIPRILRATLQEGIFITSSFLRSSKPNGSQNLIQGMVDATSFDCQHSIGQIFSSACFQNQQGLGFV